VVRTTQQLTRACTSCGQAFAPRRSYHRYCDACASGGAPSAASRLEQRPGQLSFPADEPVAWCDAHSTFLLADDLRRERREVAA